MKEPPVVQVYAWRATGMCKATDSVRCPDDGYIKVADYQQMVRLWRQAEEDSAYVRRLRDKAMNPP